MLWFPSSNCDYLVTETWAQNGRKTPAFERESRGVTVSKARRISMNFAELWSGRWESNPRPRLGKPLFYH